ncbi:hypothetical protein IF650_13220 [Cellulosimicrobium terreum]|nr:hypothetical protein [Cellulosimicrobium terreum]
MRTRAQVVLALIVGATLAGCSSPETNETAEVPSPTTTSEAPSPTPTPAKSTPKPTPTPTGPETVPVGEPVEFPSASITINSAERKDIIEGEFGETIEPSDGGSLWLLSMDWTNLSNEAVEKVCWGPYTTTLRVFDTEDREMLLDDNSGFIPGNDCSNGLMTGQSGEWFQAFQGLADAEIGYATIQEGLSDDPIAVVLNDDVSLEWSE